MRRSQLYWEDVEVGVELPAVSLEITPKRMVLQYSGTQDPYPVHYDAEFARRAGHPDIFMNTGFIQGGMVRVITDWMGDEGFLKRLRFEMRRQQRPGDTMVCRGRVTGKYEEGGTGCVDLEVWLENEREGVTTPGAATVLLPRRE